jgi:hypothetical protein
MSNASYPLSSTLGNGSVAGDEYLDDMADARSRCRDANGTEPWACGDCDCTERLERWLNRQGEPFLKEERRPTHLSRSA